MDTKTDETVMSFGELLYHFRNKAGLTQTELQQRLIGLGYPIGESTLSMWESRERLPNDSRIFHHLGRALFLDEEEETSLLRACFEERQNNYAQPYFLLKHRVLQNEK
jgi:transcriptional regulator with XRE-family HTH domain